MLKFIIPFVARVLLGILFLSPAIVKSQETGKPKEPPAGANEAAELAKKLANPIASLISVPFQNNTFYGIGPLKGTQNIMNFQPVVPIKINENLNLITR